MELSLRTRAEGLERARAERFDVAVIGGGITGAGVALEAVARGLSVVLVERADFASGTSSRSTKLIHGGLRYLRRLEFGLVRESLVERAILMRNAPRLAVPLRFLVPVFRSGTPSPLGANRLMLSLGLTLYDALAGRARIGRHTWLRPEEAAGLAPSLDLGNVAGCFSYFDCVTDDARLVVEVVKAAAARGAVVANYAPVRGLLKDGRGVAGIAVEDALGGGTVEIRARAVVNAAGVWADRVAALDDPREAPPLRPSKGIHVVVPAERLDVRAAVLVPSVEAGRFHFVLPWRGRTLVGTTDSDYAGDLDAPRAEAGEIAVLLDSVARAFPETGLSARDVISSFAGLRPLVGREGGPTAELSRKEEVLVGASGLVSVVGGKLTTYRRMAELVVDRVADRLGEGRRRSRASATASIPLAVANDAALDRILRERPELAAPLVEGLANVEAEVVYAARCEMAATVDDVLERRTRLALLDAGHGRAAAPRIAELLDEASPGRYRSRR